ncbi:hypothetical protein KC19_VG244100 [Ceratodon purpureus]|uniref:Uncharacterized protein n=1 Tax=Ceratodon purpureus TaxID=3225 RepID=A0A8T0HTZ0_CERPU|nr:hypothetical protein KC19_VG244100 [Ceratodon purpureus]
MHPSNTLESHSRTTLAPLQLPQTLNSHSSRESTSTLSSTSTTQHTLQLNSANPPHRQIDLHLKTTTQQKQDSSKTHQKRKIPDQCQISGNSTSNISNSKKTPKPCTETETHQNANPPPTIAPLDSQLQSLQSAQCLQTLEWLTMFGRFGVMAPNSWSSVL